jgi:predicted HicB family RNase H-like nuclease
MSFRVPESLLTASEEAGARQGKSISELAREALEQYLAS